MSYPPGLSNKAICHMEGHNWERGPHCSSCGKVNFWLLGQMGIAAKRAKKEALASPEARNVDLIRGLDIYG